LVQSNYRDMEIKGELERDPNMPYTLAYSVT
jgi:hypothetical protein